MVAKKPHNKKVGKASVYPTNEVLAKLKKNDISVTEVFDKGLESYPGLFQKNKVLREYITAQGYPADHRIILVGKLQELSDLNPILVRITNGAEYYSMINPKLIPQKAKQLNKGPSDLRQEMKVLIENLKKMEDNWTTNPEIFSWKAHRDDWLDDKLKDIAEYSKFERYELVTGAGSQFDRGVDKPLRVKDGHYFITCPENLKHPLCIKEFEKRKMLVEKSISLRADNERDELKKNKWIDDQRKVKEQEEWKIHKKEESERLEKIPARIKELLSQFNPILKRCQKIIQMVQKSEDKSYREKLLLEREKLKVGSSDVMNELTSLGHQFGLLDW